MVKDISQTLKDKLKKGTNKLEKEVWIDWNNDGVKDANELIELDTLELMIDKKIEGNLGVSVVDRATVDVDNHDFNFSPKNMTGKWAGNVVPARNAEISLGVDGEKVNVFSGVLRNINPDYTDFKGSITIDDKILLLQEEDAPDKFYYDVRPETIIEKWLNEVGITDYHLQNTNFIINYNFDGMKMWEAIQMINEATQAKTYVEDNTFYYETRLSLDYDTEKEPVYSFVHKNSKNENVWEITEEYGVSDMYNKVVFESNPYRKEDKKVIWTGAEEDSRITEEYKGSDIDSNGNLQLTYVPEGESTEETTKNVPIVEGTIAIDNLSDETQPTYKEGEGIDKENTDYANGVIAFANTSDYPIPSDNHHLSISYKYYFNQLDAGKEKNFNIELDNPAINIDNLLVYAEAVENSSSQDTYETEGTFGYFDDMDFTYLRPFTYVSRASDNSTSNLKVKFLVTNQKDKSTMSFDYTLYYRKDTEVQWTEWTSNGFYKDNPSETSYFFNKTINNLFPSQYQVKLEVNNIDSVSVTATFYNDVISSNSGFYSKNRKVPISFTDSSAPIYVEQNVKENQQQVDIRIKNNTDVKVKLFGKQQEEETVNFFLKGEPFEQNNKLRVVEKDQDSIEGFDITNSHSISNNLVQSHQKMKEVAKYFIWQHSTPRTRLEIKATPAIQLQFGDVVEVIQENRDIDNKFIVKGITHEINEDNEWDVRYQLVQAYPSDWTYTEDGTPVLDGSKNNRVPSSEPPNIIPLENINIEERGSQLPDGTYIPEILVEWIKPDNCRITRIYYKFINDNTFEEIGQTQKDRYKIKVVKKGIYQIKLVGESFNGIQNPLDEVPIAQIEIVGKDDKPSKINFEKIYWGADYIKIVWQPHPDKDFDEYEVRLDDDFGAEEEI